MIFDEPPKMARQRRALTGFQSTVQLGAWKFVGGILIFRHGSRRN
jgi:hypothetical protein